MEHKAYVVVFIGDLNRGVAYDTCRDLGTLMQYLGPKIKNQPVHEVCTALREWESDPDRKQAIVLDHRRFVVVRTQVTQEYLVLLTAPEPPTREEERVREMTERGA